MIPNKNLFVVTSAVKPVIGVYSHEDRYQQTIDTLISLRNAVKDDIIMVVDVSVVPLTDEERKGIIEKCDIFMDANMIPIVRELSLKGLKSHAENALLYNVLMNFKFDFQLQKILQPVKRIFKYSARTLMNEDFDIRKYDGLFGKFVFKKRIPTWMPEVKHEATNLLITRMFSFCPSLIDIYLDVIQKNFNILDDLDTEHAHFVNIPEKYLVEFETLGCEGFLAGNGKIERY